MKRQSPAKTPIQSPPLGVPSEVDALIRSALTLLRQQKTGEGTAELEKALVRARALKSTAGQAHVLYVRGQVEARTGQREKAMGTLEAAQALLSDDPKNGLLPQILSLLGQVQLASSQPQRALSTYEKALALFRASNQILYQAQTLARMGRCQSFMGALQKAITLLTEAVTLFEKTTNREDLATSLIDLGTFHSMEDNQTQAQVFFDRSLVIARDLKNVDLEAAGLLNKGISQMRALDERARGTIEQAIPLFRQAGDLPGIASGLMNLGTMLQLLDRPDLALPQLTQALEMHRQLKNDYMVHRNLGEIAVIYSQLGNDELSIPFLEQSLAFFKKNGFRADELTYSNFLASCYRRVNRIKDAENLALLAIDLAKLLNDRYGLINIEQLRGSIALQNKEYKISRACFQKAYDLAVEIDNKRSIISSLIRIGGTYHAEHDFQKAIGYARKALRLSQEIKNLSDESFARLCIAQSLIFIDAKQGPKELEAAIVLSENLYKDLSSQTNLSFTTNSRTSHYLRLLVIGAVQNHDSLAAFNYTQRAKNRVLRERMAQVYSLPSTALSPAEREQETKLKERSTLLNRRLIGEGVNNAPGSQQRAALLQTELKTLEAEQAAFTDALYSRHPQLATQRAQKTATLAEIATQLPPDTALIEFVTVESEFTKKGGILLVILSRDSEGKPLVESQLLKEVIEETIELVADLRSACADPTKAYITKARLLYERLIAPMEAQLVGKKRLILCPDSFLWELPFAVLTDPKGASLIERFELAFAYSGTMLHAAISSRQGTAPAPKSVLAVANPDFGSESRFATTPSAERPILQPDRPILQPDRAQLLPRGARITPLPGTQKEAEVLKKLFPDATVLTGKAAQESTVLPALTQHRFIHLATHGFFNDALPLDSQLLLAEPPASQPENDGLLSAKELLAADMSRCELVVLSACNTARGKVGGGEGLIGLPWALFAAGCRTQVVSQWAVNDTTTATLMEHFYTKLQQKVGKSAALRSAALALRSDGSHQHPYYWAPFIVLGDWR